MVRTWNLTLLLFAWHAAVALAQMPYGPTQGGFVPGDPAPLQPSTAPVGMIQPVVGHAKGNGQGHGHGHGLGQGPWMATPPPMAPGMGGPPMPNPDPYAHDPINAWNQDAYCPNNHLAYLKLEYLSVWADGARTPPLVTADPEVNGGNYGGEGTTLILGNERVDFAPMSGTRLTLGYWLTDDQSLAIEASYFLTERIARTIINQSVSPNNPTLARVFLDEDNFESFVLRANPWASVGSTSDHFSLQIQCSEISLKKDLSGAPMDNGASVNFLIGPRWLHVSDLYSNRDGSQTLPLVSGIDITQSDQFRTNNHWYGGQVGSTLKYHLNGISLEVGGKIGYGAVWHTLTTRGETITLDNAAPSKTASNTGLYVQRSNTGRFQAREASLLGELDLGWAIQLNDNIYFNVGYSVTAVNNIIRATDQIDRRISFSPPPFVPEPLMSSSTFSFQMLNVGFEMRF